MSQYRMYSCGTNRLREHCLYYSSLLSSEGNKDSEELKTSGAQVHWLDYQKLLSSPHPFIETYDDSGEAAASDPLMYLRVDSEPQTCQHNRAYGCVLVFLFV